MLVQRVNLERSHSVTNQNTVCERAEVKHKDKQTQMKARTLSIRVAQRQSITHSLLQQSAQLQLNLPGTLQSSNTSSPVLDPLIPNLSSLAAWLKPSMPWQK